MEANPAILANLDAAIDRALESVVEEQQETAGPNEGWHSPAVGSSDSESDDGPKIEPIGQKVSFFEKFCFEFCVFCLGCF